jgi:hypothetical protein
LKTFEEVFLRGVFGRRRDGVARSWRKFHNEELHNLYPSSDIIRIIKLRRMRWAGRVAFVAGKRNACRVEAGKQQGKSH